VKDTSKQQIKREYNKENSLSGFGTISKILKDVEKLNSPLTASALQAQLIAERMTKGPIVSAWQNMKKSIFMASDSALLAHYASSQARMSKLYELSGLQHTSINEQFAAMSARSLHFSSSLHSMRFLSNATSLHNNNYDTIFSMDQTVRKTFEMLKKFNFSRYDFEISDEDELQVEKFDLVSDPSIVIPEKRVVLLKELTHIEKTIAAIYHDNKQLYNVHHREFEEMMAELLKSRGFEVHLTKQTRDGGKDIIALRNMDGLPLKMLVECKKNAPHRKIGVDIIRGFSHVINTMKANKGVIFTTSYFSEDAKKEKDTHMPYLLDLRDRNDVIAWIKEYVE
jgi:HJR/Mrr/RecB family endonuclease